MGLTFHAPLLATLVPAAAVGSAVPTYVRGGGDSATTIDHDGLVRLVSQGGAARFHGARYIYNQAAASELFTPTGLVTLTTGFAGPTGALNATRAVYGAATNGDRVGCGDTGPTFTEGTAAQSIWLRGEVGGEQVMLWNGWANGLMPLTLTTAWARYCQVGLTGNNSNGLFLYAITGTPTIYVTQFQIENTSGASNQAPGEYVSRGVAASPYHGAGADGVRYFTTANGNRANLLAASEEFNLPAWNFGGLSVGLNVSPNVETAPDGTLTADKIFESATTDEHRRCGSIVALATTYTRRFSFYAKAAERTVARFWTFSGPNNFECIFDLVAGVCAQGSSGLDPTMESAGGGWWRCSGNVVAGQDSTVAIGPAPSMAAGTGTYLGIVGNGIYLWGAMLETGTTTGSYIKSGSMVEGGGADIPGATLRGYLYEQSVANRCLRSQEFDNATWVKTNVTVAANSTAAPDGTLSADTLTASAANGTTIQDLGIVASACKTFSVWLKRLTGTGNVDLTLNAGGAWTTVAVTASWQRFVLSNAALANEDVGIRIVASGDAVYAWGAQAETQPAGDTPAVSSYIPTTTAGVTRNDDALSYPSTSNMPQLFWTVYCEARRDVLGGNSTPFRAAVNVGSYTTNASVSLGNYGNGTTHGALTMLGAWPGVFDISLSGPSTPMAGIPYRAAFTLAANGTDAVVYTNGTPTAGTAAVPKASAWAGATMSIGGMPGASGGSGHSVTVRNIRIWDRVLLILPDGSVASGGGIIWRRRGLRAR